MNMDWKGADPRLVARAMEYGISPQAGATEGAQSGLYWGSGNFGIPHRHPVAMPMAMPGPGGPGGYNRYREMTLEEMLLENRVVFLVGEINHVSAARVYMQMLYLQSVKKDSDINLYINSPGGHVVDTLAIYDVMK